MERDRRERTEAQGTRQYDQRNISRMWMDVIAFHTAKQAAMVYGILYTNLSTYLALSAYVTMVRPPDHPVKENFMGIRREKNRLRGFILWYSSRFKMIHDTVMVPIL